MVVSYEDTYDSYEKTGDTRLLRLLLCLNDDSSSQNKIFNNMLFHTFINDSFPESLGLSQSLNSGANAPCDFSNFIFPGFSFFSSNETGLSKKTFLDIMKTTSEPKHSSKGEFPSGFMTARQMASHSSEANKVESARKIPPQEEFRGNAGNMKAFTLPVVDSKVNNKKSEEKSLSSPIIDSKIIKIIENEIIVSTMATYWDDIIGLEDVKSKVKELIVWPLLRPDLFVGLRGPPKGLLLYGPPGTGKTMLGKCIASQSNSTFFSVSASTLVSKWYGESEKLVRGLFVVARDKQPSVIFIDEIDSLLMKRKDDESDCTRRIKTEFLLQFDGIGSNSEDMILVVGATNRPQDLDDAARRRFSRRLYVPLPNRRDRINLAANLLRNYKNSVDSDQLEEIGNNSEYYSASDLTGLCREAALEPLRVLTSEEISSISLDQIESINIDHFRNAFKNTRPSVCRDDLASFEKWNEQFGNLH